MDLRTAFALGFARQMGFSVQVVSHYKCARCGYIGTSRDDVKSQHARHKQSCSRYRDLEKERRDAQRQAEQAERRRREAIRRAEEADRLRREKLREAKEAERAAEEEARLEKAARTRQRAARLAKEVAMRRAKDLEVRKTKAKKRHIQASAERKRLRSLLDDLERSDDD